MSKRMMRDLAVKKLGLAVLASILAFTLGCSADDIMGPGITSGQIDEPSGDFEILSDPTGKDIDPIQGVSPKDGSALIKADVGGVVSCGRFQVEIPAGALSEDTEINIIKPDPELVMCELEPHGIQFNKPVTLRIDYSGTVADGAESITPDLGVYWYDDDDGRWYVVGREINVESSTMEAHLGHFSKYGSGAVYSTAQNDSKYGSGAIP